MKQFWQLKASKSNFSCKQRFRTKFEGKKYSKTYPSIFINK